MHKRPFFSSSVDYDYGKVLQIRGNMDGACSITDPNFTGFVSYCVVITSNAQLNSTGPSKTEARKFQSTELFASKRASDNDR